MKISNAILLLAQVLSTQGDEELPEEFTKLLGSFIGNEPPVDNTETLKREAYNQGANYARLAPNGSIDHNPYAGSALDVLASDWDEGFYSAAKLEPPNVEVTEPQ